MNKPIHILLADDDRDDRFFFEKALSLVSIPNKLSTVHDGEQLTTFLVNNTANLPDVVFLDINMPRKNGAECLRDMKSNSIIAHLPVVIYSTSLTEESADQLYSDGAHFYFQKCDFTELPDLLHKVLYVMKKETKRPPRQRFVVNSLVI